MGQLIKEKHLEDFCDFSRQMLETRDYDPNYFAVKGVIEERGYDKAKAFDFCVTFNGFYHFGSADTWFQDQQSDPSVLPYGKSRRGFRGNHKVLAFIHGCRELRNFIFKTGEAGGFDAWRNIYNAFLCVPGCGYWSAFYLTDMMKVILGFKITSPNFGHLGSSPNKTGPLAGLELLTGISIQNLMKRDDVHFQIFEETKKLTPWTGMEEMESVLCNYLSLQKKMYYVGRDIDRQLPMLEGLGPEWFRARKKYFPSSLLGEENDWSGIRKNLMGSFEKGKTWK